MKNLLLGVSLLIMSTLVSAQDNTPQPDPSNYQPAIKQAEHWGRLIYDYDQTVAKATDIALSNRTFKRDKRVQGWITSMQSDGIATLFVGPEAGGAPAVLYEVSPATNFALSALDPPRPLTAEESGEFTARQTALAAMTSPCSKSYNTIVLPLKIGDTDAWRVYLLPGTTKQNVVLVGGYYRYDVSSDGNTITSQRAFTRSCLELVNDKRTAGLMATHLLDPQPTEVHVFASLLARKPFYVGTTGNRILWMIDGGKISTVDTSGDE